MKNTLSSITFLTKINKLKKTSLMDLMVAFFWTVISTMNPEGSRQSSSSSKRS